MPGFMKKIKSLTIPLGLLVILVLAVFSPVRATDVPSDDPVTTESTSEPEQDGPPWYPDPAWHYRRPVIISNSGGYIGYYQVLVELDEFNFDFSKAKADGSDIRFTDTDGTTDLDYWIESWNSSSQQAYVWVKVSRLFSGNTTLYLYYNNPTAGSLSDGVKTFDGFDENWSQFSVMGTTQGEETQSDVALTAQPMDDIDSLIIWSPIGPPFGLPSASSGILSLTAGTGIKSSSTYQYKAVGFSANFGSGNGDESGGFIKNINMADQRRTSIGDRTEDASNLYLINYVNALDHTLLPKVGVSDWHNKFHVYEVRWKDGQSIGDINHGVSTESSINQVPTEFLPVTLYSDMGSNATLMVDWVYVRQYRDPEPTVYVSDAEQGLVDLAIAMIDFPDPVSTITRLTYQLTISNDSIIDAPGVVVTDTLPADVTPYSKKASQGVCTGTTVIVCSLNSISAGKTASITIEVIPTLDGVVTNMANVGSPGFELDLSDNVSNVATRVDSVPPDVSWDKPVKTGKYITYGGTIALEAFAGDLYGIDRVEFWWYDPDAKAGAGEYYLIGKDYISPFQASFDSNQLIKLGFPYWFELRAYDRAGNTNFPQNRVNIYIQRDNIIFLPLVIK